MLFVTSLAIKKSANRAQIKIKRTVMYQPLAEGGDKNYPGYLQKQARYYEQGPRVENQSTSEIPQEKSGQTERSREWKRGGSRNLIDNPQPSGPRMLVGKGWIFMSF